MTSNPLSSGPSGHQPQPQEIIQKYVQKHSGPAQLPHVKYTLALTNLLRPWIAS